MHNDWLEFLARIAWPLVALVGVLILGPGGVLQNLIGELAKNLFAITGAVNDFKATAGDFEQTRKELKESTLWVAQLEDQLLAISGRLESINSVTQQLAISEGNRSLLRAVDDGSSGVDGSDVEGRSPEEMFGNIRDQWETLISKLRARVGADAFDARSVGQMAWKLVDGRRTHQLSHSDAELIERLHSQMKRFNRLQSSKDEWLTHDTYAAFIRGVEQACTALD